MGNSALEFAVLAHLEGAELIQADLARRSGVSEKAVQLVLDPLVAHFRSFETGVIPSPSRSTYRDLALSRRGVCRHRAYAFTITALAAGIPLGTVCSLASRTNPSFASS